MNSSINSCRICYEENIENVSICKCTNCICKNCLIKEVRYTERERNRLECTICKVSYKKIYKNRSLLFYWMKAIFYTKDSLLYKISNNELWLLILSITTMLLWNINNFPIYNNHDDGFIVFIDTMIFIVNIIIYNRFITTLHNSSIYLLFFPLIFYSIRYYLDINNSNNSIFPCIIIINIIIHTLNLAYIIRDNYKIINMEICVDENAI